MASHNPALQHPARLAWAVWHDLPSHSVDSRHALAGPAGWQHDFRSRCGTGCCYAGHVALHAGGQWLVHIDHDRQMFIDGLPVTE